MAEKCLEQHIFESSLSLSLSLSLSQGSQGAASEGEQAGKQTAADQTPKEGQQHQQQVGHAPGIEQLLLAMESRLAAKIEKTNEAATQASNLAKKTNEALEDLELRVEANEVGVREEIRETIKEDRIIDQVRGQVKTMVDDQLRSAGYDQDLSAGDLTLRSSVVQRTETGGGSTLARSYAETAGEPPSSLRSSGADLAASKEERREEKFWRARRSLRMRPVCTANREGVCMYV